MLGQGLADRLRCQRKLCVLTQILLESQILVISCFVGIICFGLLIDILELDSRVDLAIIAVGRKISVTVVILFDFFLREQAHCIARSSFVHEPLAFIRLVSIKFDQRVR